MLFNNPRLLFLKKGMILKEKKNIQIDQEVRIQTFANILVMR